MKKSETMKADAMKTAAKLKEETAKVKEETVKAVKAADAKAEAVKTETAKAVKAADAKVESVKAAAKKVTKKATTKKALVPDFYVQFGDREYTQDDVVKKVKEVWTKQMKKKVGDMKKLRIYMKPEEYAAYYVINDDVVGRVEL